MSKQIQHILEAVGLHPKEAKLYLVGLQLGNAPASAYAKKTHLNRITAYNTLEHLVRKGHFTTMKKVRAKWYAPVAPEYLSVEARKNAQALDHALPELRSIRGAEARQPHVRFFEGWEGARRVYEDTFTADDELLNFANSVIIRKYWPRYDEEYVQERVRRNIRLRGIAPDDATGRKVQGMDKESLREIRLVSAKDFDFTNEINIYGNKVAIVTFGDDESALFGVIIESKEVAETQRQIFEMAWRYAEQSVQK